MVKLEFVKRLLTGIVSLALSVSGCGKKNSSTSSDQPAEKSIGIAFYPKSRTWSSLPSSGDQSTNASSTRETEDPPDKVIEFYKKELKEPKVSRDDVGDIVHANVSGKTKDGAGVDVAVMRMPPQKTQIFISVRRQK